jgi:cell division protease FtsH
MLIATTVGLWSEMRLRVKGFLHRYTPGVETTTEPLSEQTSREIDMEVKRLMTEAHNTAVGVLRDQRPALDAVMRRLLDREVVEGSEVRSLVKSAAATGPRAA